MLGGGCCLLLSLLGRASLSVLIDGLIRLLILDLHPTDLGHTRASLAELLFQLLYSVFAGHKLYIRGFHQLFHAEIALLQLVDLVCESFELAIHTVLAFLQLLHRSFHLPLLILQLFNRSFSLLDQLFGQSVLAFFVFQLEVELLLGLVLGLKIRL